MPLNIHFLWETEEEIGSPSFEGGLNRHKGRFRTDAIVVSDTLEKATILALTLEQAARYHLEAEAVGGTEFPSAEARRGKAKYHQHH